MNDAKVNLMGVAEPTGVALIAQERERQIAEEGYDSKHDQDHADQLAAAGAGYAEAAMVTINPSLSSWDTKFSPLDWPWSEAYWKPSDDPVRMLVKAGALIAAAIDALEGRRSRRKADPRITRIEALLDEAENAPGRSFMRMHDGSPFPVLINALELRKILRGYQ